MRPRFELKVDCGVEDVMRQLKARLSGSARPVVGNLSRRHAVLTTPAERHHLWSPNLSLAVEEREDGTWVRGQFSPHPHVWTGFMFTYGTLFMLGLAGVMYGVAQLSLGRAPWALFAPVATAALAGFVYGAAFIGQGLGADEMYELRRFFDECLEEAESISRAAPKTPRDSAAL